MSQQINHHLTDELLMAYAAGALPEAFDLLVASHVSLCDQCRATLASYEALGGAVMETSKTAPMSENAFAQTLALIAQDAPHPPEPRRPSRVPGPLAHYVGDDLASVKWSTAGMGVKQAILPVSGEASARLLFIPAGAAMPDHGHHGQEMTMVLEGAFEDEGVRFGRGDVEIADQTTHHSPTATAEADCICLVVTNAPLQFKGLWPRIAQPFLRI